MATTPDTPDGVLAVDKPEGPTSHDVVARARRALHERRIGHTGTLDPFASGLLLLCIGRATRIAEYLTRQPKSYRATLRLGAATATDDRTGDVIASSDAWRTLSHAGIAAALQAEVGQRPQTPPAYSAKKIEGRRAYQLARAGAAVAVASADVEIASIDLIDVALPDVTFDVRCSSGTYIRAIARDVGERLGVYGHLGALRRTAIGEHRVADALPLDALDDEARVRAALITPADAVRGMPRIEVDSDGAAAIAHGRALDVANAPDADPVAVVHAHALIAIASVRAGRVHPRKVFL
jgi:tRNA pseudouridine55 synthase